MLLTFHTNNPPIAKQLPLLLVGWLGDFSAREHSYSLLQPVLRAYIVARHEPPSSLVGSSIGIAFPLLLMREFPTQGFLYVAQNSITTLAGDHPPFWGPPCLCSSICGHSLAAAFYSLRSSMRTSEGNLQFRRLQPSNSKSCPHTPR